MPWLEFEIPDPYDSFIKVAELPTIFVEFSLPGVVNQQIDKIDLIGPVLYIGQGLFWWVDYQRNHRKQNEGTGFTENLGGAPLPPVDEEGAYRWIQKKSVSGSKKLAARDPPPAERVSRSGKRSARCEVQAIRLRPVPPPGAGPLSTACPFWRRGSKPPCRR